MPIPLQRKRADTQACFFWLPRRLLPVLPWPSKRHGGRPRPTSCSGSGVGTTPGRQRGHGLRGRRSSASARRARRLLQVRCAAGFLPSFRHASRKAVISTHARSEGTACSWDEFSILGSSHHLLRQVWSGVLGTSGCLVLQLPRISWRSNLAAVQIEVGAVSKQTLLWLDG